MPTKRYTVVDSGDSTRGKFVIAAQDLSAGALVLAEDPIAFCLSPNYWKARCSFCLQKGQDLLQCSRCKAQWFCGQQCFKSAWKRFHRQECPLFRQALLSKAGITDVASVCDTLLLSRILRTAVVGRKRGIASDGLASLSVPDSTERKDEDIQLLAHKLSRAAETFGPSFWPEGEDENDIATTLYKFRCNNFGITDILLSNIAAGVYPEAAKLNHSCQPNCCISYHNGMRLHIYTTQPVAKGEELFHAYIDVAATTEDRRRKLLASYAFWCTCPLCQRARLVPQLPGAEKEESIELDRAFHGTKGELSADEKKQLAVARKLEESVAEIDDPQQELSVLTKVFSVKLRLLSPLNLELKTLRTQLVSLCLLTEHWKEAELHAEVLCEIYQRIYGDYHPLLGLQLLTLGDIQLNKAGNVEAAMKSLRRARTVLSTTCGDEAESVLLVSSMLAEAEPS